MRCPGANQETFSVTIEQRDHAAYLRLYGEIDIATAPILERKLEAAESNGHAAIVVDLQQVTFMDASGLRVFLRAKQRAIRSGRTFSMTGSPRRVMRVLRITGTTHLLHQVNEHSFAAQAMAEGNSDASSQG